MGFNYAPALAGADAVGRPLKNLLRAIKGWGGHQAITLIPLGRVGVMGLRPGPRAKTENGNGSR
ncbi:hypothetical protein A7C91_06650 [Thermococcus piezophilus]|uniref:Uncharacterized protein n=1 Tax=Thermococcus piezophilus TaxID=1712654 RepID=A0A172WHU9_9EURY|nr:hypothetical protein A7C91_06650 [Thermococcus piezophilus]